MIYDSVSFIESRLSDELNVNYLAEQMFYSKSHYKRLFQAVIGEPVMEYVKKRRLQRAGMMLCETDKTILEIALHFGYSSHEGFSRAFKIHFGMPPLQYRQRYAPGKNIHREESKIMITNESRKNIAGYANDVTRDWESLTKKLEKCCTRAENEIEKDKRTSGGIAVAFTEWRNLIAKLKNAGADTNRLFAEETDIYELYDKADVLMKVLDDIFFQMNLLRFLTGIEWSRMGEHGIPFKPILDDLTLICYTKNESKGSAVKLVSEIKVLIRAEIKREAFECIKGMAEKLNETVKQGVSLSEQANKLVINMGTYGRGFALIAKETEKVVFGTRDFESIVLRILEKTTDQNKDVISSDDRKLIRSVISQTEDNAFKMNVNAFNAAVETARAGDAGEPGCRLCTEGIYKYAYELQITAMTCNDLYNDYLKFIAMTDDEMQTNNIRSIQKQYEDIIFQASGMNTQISLESARSGREDFQKLSQNLEEALEILKKEVCRNDSTDKPDNTGNIKMFKSYHEKLSTLIEQGLKTATAAGPHGAGITYILNEFNLMNAKLEKSI